MSDSPFAQVLSGQRVSFIAQGDCRLRLKELPDNSIDCVVTDPPAGIAFMGKAWDRMRREGMTELQAFQEFIFEVFTEVHRVLKPGGHAVVWALPRTAHHTTMGVERAGFEIRDVVHHLFGTGFPKSMDVSKAIDKAAGAERPVVGTSKRHTSKSFGGAGDVAYGAYQGGTPPITAPATEEVTTWSGWGTALKPAAENWILARKPLIGTVVQKRLGARNRGYEH